MCGVVGWLGRREMGDRKESILKMIRTIQHRGPDGDGVHVEEAIGLGHTRLSIVDLAQGSQPMHTADGRYTIVFNGEIFNHKALRSSLERNGHIFRTQCDTEVLLHLFVQYGPSAVERLNGEWSFAIWDRVTKRLFLSRDPTGVRPLHYVFKNGDFAFASEVKALFVLPWIERSLDPETLDDILHFWAPLPGRTSFKGVQELPPGHSMFVSEHTEPDIFAYWDLTFPTEKRAFRSEEEAVKALRETLSRAVRLRLDADVPVGSYLSGGLDSSIVAFLAQELAPGSLATFGLSFADKRFDEGVYQRHMAQALGTHHHTLYCTEREIGDSFFDVVRHTERPVIRTAPAPMYLLSKLVRDRGYKVVLTGEGADEFFGGYDIFREALARRYLHSRPQAKVAQVIFSQLYQYMPEIHAVPPDFVSGFFRQEQKSFAPSLFSHVPRIELTRRIRGLLHPDLRMKEYSACERLVRTLPFSFRSLSLLEKSQYLEAKVLMPGYILSSQGDRMTMAHGVEGRFPFLDPQVIDFASRLPSHLRVLGLKEKWLLKKLGERILPREIWERPKQPFRAPDADILRKGVMPSGESLLQVLESDRIRQTGIFCPIAMEVFRKRIVTSQRPLSLRDQMALSFAVSTQILHETHVSP